MANQPLPRIIPVDVERLKSFSDNIYAFSMTLLITSIHLPEIARDEIADRLLGVLMGEWRQFAIYAISFLNIASYWLIHHSIYNHIRQLDKLLIWLNILLLLTVTFLPLPTALTGKYGRDSATALLYGITIAANYFMLCLIVRYVSLHPELARKDLYLPVKRVLLLKCGLPLALALSGGALSFVHTNFSFLLYMTVALINTVPWQNILRDAERLPE